MTNDVVDAAASGLTRAQVEQRIQAGQANRAPDGPSRSAADIVRANIVTRFNIILTVLLVVILAVAPPQDALFGLVMVINAGIGVFQELRAKQQLDSLALVSAPKARVFRDGQIWAVATEDIVLDDILEISAGDQIVVDGTITQTDHVEVDESLLTGESDAVSKTIGDAVLSGSFVVAGTARFVATAVGQDAYAVQLAEEAKQFTLVRSELRAGIDLMLRVITWLLVPAAALLIWSQLQASVSVRAALSSSVAGLVAMVPQGLVLVTSLAFAVGAIRLARRQVLVRELPAVEGLARVDVVCFDKTGTLTEGRIVHRLTTPLGDGPVSDVLGAIAAADPSPNATMSAIAEVYPPPADWQVDGTVPFSSDRKWSAFSFGRHGSWVIGAPEMMPLHRPDIGLLVDEQTTTGRRVLIVCRVPSLPVDGRLEEPVEPLALLGLGDTVRETAPETLAFFDAQGVAVKVISGDHPETVGAISRAAGVPGADRVVDARTMPTEPADLADVVEQNTVFGRVSPQQKRDMVRALQSRGHVVAMSGDGVNDVLALKEADIGVAMGSGSSASRSVAQLVLVDGDFATLPGVVAEGRRVIANIERVANLYLAKTVYAFALIVAIGLSGLSFPFLPRHLTLVGSITIGIPSFFLALEPSNRRARPGFAQRVFRFAVPAGVVAAIATYAAFGLAEIEAERLQETRTVATLVLASVGLFILAIVMRPLTPKRQVLLWAMAGLFGLVFLVPAARDFFDLDLPRAVVVLAGIGIVGLAGVVMYLSLQVSGWLHSVPQVVRSTQVRVRQSGFSLARLRALRTPPHIRTDDTTPPHDEAALEAPAADVPDESQLSLPIEAESTD